MRQQTSITITFTGIDAIRLSGHVMGLLRKTQNKFTKYCQRVHGLDINTEYKITKIGPVVDLDMCPDCRKSKKNKLHWHCKCGNGCECYNNK